MGREPLNEMQCSVIYWSVSVWMFSIGVVTGSRKMKVHITGIGRLGSLTQSQMWTESLLSSHSWSQDEWHPSWEVKKLAAQWERPVSMWLTLINRFKGTSRQQMCGSDRLSGHTLFCGRIQLYDLVYNSLIKQFYRKGRIVVEHHVPGSLSTSSHFTSQQYYKVDSITLIPQMNPLWPIEFK